MGAWNFGPIDNDTAADWMGTTMAKSKLPKLIGQGLKSKDTDEVRAAALLLEQVGYTYMYDIDVLDKHLKLAVKQLGKILKDDDWLSSWTDSGEVRKSVQRQISELKKRLKGGSAPGSMGLMQSLDEKLGG